MPINTLQDTPPELPPKQPKKVRNKSSQITLSSSRASLMIQRLDHILQSLDSLSINPEERELQRQTYTAIRESLRRGEKSGIIKLPTGTGKTWVFANLLKIFQRNGLILVPRVDLYDSTIRDLREVGFRDHEIHLISEETGANSEERMLSHLTDPSIDWSSGRNVTIMTYQSLNSMFKKNPEIGSFMRSHFDMIIEDEAHRAIGKKTKKAVGALTEEMDGEGIELDLIDQTEQSELQEELEAENIVEHILGLDDESFKNDNRFNYKFTATPDLLRHSVSDESEYIFYATFEQAVRTRAIVLPQYVSMGSAYLRSGDLEKWKVKDIEALSDQEDDQFIDENGLSIRDKIINAYIEEKQRHNNSLPAVAFASTIKHAAILVDAMRAKGIKAQRVTSDKSDISSKRATEMMDRGELDVIVTVTKVSEGFDYAPLSCAMWFAPVLSPAKITQGNGRIARDAPGKMPEQIEDEQGRIIPSPSAYIIAPSEWYGGMSRKETSGGGNGGGTGGSASTSSPPKKLARIGNFYELLVSQDEFDYNCLPIDLREMISIKNCLVCEIGEEKIVDNVVYIGVVPESTVLEVQGRIILDNVRKSKPNLLTFQGKQKNGYSIQLIQKDFIEGLKIKKNWQYECNFGEEIIINGVVHIGVVPGKEISGIQTHTILDNAKKQNISVVQGIQSENSTSGRRSIQIIPKDFIEGLKKSWLYVCDHGEEIVIDNIIYIGILESAEYMKIPGRTIIGEAKKQILLVIKNGRQKTGPKKGLGIRLIPKDFIEGLKKEWQYECDHGEEIIINNVIHVGVSKTGELINGLTYKAIVYSGEKQNIKMLTGRQTLEGVRGRLIRLVPKKFIEFLLNTCEVGEEKEIDGVVRVGVTGTQDIRGLKGATVIVSAKKDPNITILQGRQKSGHPIQLIPKSFIESLVTKKTKQ